MQNAQIYLQAFCAVAQTKTEMKPLRYGKTLWTLPPVQQLTLRKHEHSSGSTGMRDRSERADQQT